MKKTVSLTVNGAPVTAEVEPRLHLADFLREHRLLTGTHIGCEHGVCGACTVLIGGEPARSCITLAVACEGAAVQTVEGLDDDPIAARLRAAFTAEHGLQCGYCTPGMLMTARDIVVRLPDADADRVRLELSGNLCRCTGYAGIVRAILRVLKERPDIARAKPAELPAGRFAAAAQPAAMPAPPREAAAPGGSIVQSLRLSVPRDAVWHAIQDPALVAGCVPGSRILSQENGRIRGEMLASLGPMRARFAGEATVTYDAATHAGRIVGEGRDNTTGTRLSGEASFRVAEDGPAASTIELSISYALRGPLAQFGRGPIVQLFARDLAASTARNLEARLRGESIASTPTRLDAGSLMLRAAWQWLRGLFTR